LRHRVELELELELTWCARMPLGRATMWNSSTCL